jgi:hypothetical protein
MAVAFHRGLSHELKYRLQLAGVRIEEIDAQRALAGKPIVTGAPWTWIDSYLERIFDPSRKQQLMLQWENDNPDKKPFPPLFAEVVLNTLRSLDPDNVEATVARLIELAEGELLFG